MSGSITASSYAPVPNLSKASEISPETATKLRKAVPDHDSLDLYDKYSTATQLTDLDETDTIKLVADGIDADRSISDEAEDLAHIRKETGASIHTSKALQTLAYTKNPSTDGGGAFDYSGHDAEINAKVDGTIKDYSRVRLDLADDVSDPVKYLNKMYDADVSVDKAIELTIRGSKGENVQFKEAHGGNSMNGALWTTLGVVGTIGGVLGAAAGGSFWSPGAALAGMVVAALGVAAALHGYQELQSKPGESHLKEKQWLVNPT